MTRVEAVQLIRLVLSDEQWKRVEKLCIGKSEDPGGTGANNRVFIGLCVDKMGTAAWHVPFHNGARIE